MDSQWLNTQFKLNPNKSKTGLAGAMGLEPPAISKILKGSRQIKAHEYAAMRRYFGLPVDGERSLGKNNDGYVLEPLSSPVGLKDHDGNEDSSEWVIPADILSQRTQAAPDQVKIFQIQENTMAPEFLRGEHVVVDLSDTEPSPPGTFIIFDGFSYLIRHCEYLPQSTPPEIKVSANDKSFTPQVVKKNALEIIGRAIAKLQWL